MTWRITWGDWRTGAEVPVYSPLVGELRPIEQSFTCGVDGEAGSLELTLAPDHPAFESMSVADPESWAEVYNDSYSETEPYWRGVLTETREPFADSDYGQMEFTFAGELSQLAYATVPRVSTTFEAVGTESAALRAVTWLLEQYNANTEARRRIAVGMVDSFGTSSVRIEDDGDSTVLEVLTDTFVEGLGAYVRLRYADDTVLLDVVQRFADSDGADRVSAQPIRFGWNLLEMTRELSAVDLYTGVKPYGADLGDTEYAGRYYTDWRPVLTRPSAWRDSYSEHYTASVFEPLEGEPEGWYMSVADAHEGGFKAWSEYWYWDRSAGEFKPLSSATATRPTWLDRASDGRVWLWDCKVADPYGLASIEDVMEAVQGYGYTRIDQKPADWDGSASGYYEPVFETVHTPYRASASSEVEWVDRTVMTWKPADTTYERVTTMPKKWYWESADGNYASYYLKHADVYDPTTGARTDKYEKVAKVKKKVDNQPKKWADKYTSWWWADPDGKGGYSHVPKHSRAVDCIGGFSAAKWRVQYEQCYKRSVNEKTGVEKFTPYSGTWHKVSGRSAWCPSTGSNITISKANWKRIRGNLWRGTEGKGKKAHGKSSCKSQKWGEHWSVSGGYLYTDKDHKKRERLWYKEPPCSWSEAKGNCWKAAAPRFGLKAVYREVIPTWSHVTAYKAVAPTFVAGKYWAKRAEDTAPWVESDDPTVAQGMRTWNSWATEPVYASTGADELPLTLDLLSASELESTIAEAARLENVGADIEVDGQTVWDLDAAAEYGRRSAQATFDDATTFVELARQALRSLAASTVPSCELDVAALDRSPEDDESEPLLPGMYVPVIDEVHGLGSEDAPMLLPLVEVDGIDFSDPTAGKVSLGGGGAALSRQRSTIAGRLAERGAAQVVFSTSVRQQLEAGFNG